MILPLCILVSILLFTVVTISSRDILAFLPVRLSAVIYVVTALTIVAALSAKGVWFNSDFYLGDLWTAQDSLHKTAAGIRSSLDYFNPIGPVMEWTFAATLLIHSASSFSIVIANSLIALLAFLLSLILLHGKASEVTVAIICLISVTTAVSPRDIDTLTTFAQSSMLAPYNRWGWALLVPIVAHAALPPRGFWLGRAIVAGVGVSVLALLKVTYGLAAVGIYLVTTILYIDRWRETGVVFLSAAIAVVLLDLVSEGQVSSYIHDLSLTAGLPANGFRTIKLLSELPVFILYSIGTLILLLSINREAASQAGWWKSDVGRTYIVAVAVGASGVVVLMQNHYTTEAVIMFIMPLIVAERSGIFASIEEGGRNATLRPGGEWGLVVLLVCVALPVVDLGYVIAQVIQTHRKASLASQFSGTEYADLVVDEVHQQPNGVQCTTRTCSDVRKMLQGRELIERGCAAYRTSAVLAFAFSNPFPALLGSPSPKHAPIWFDVDRSFSRWTHVPARQLFAGVGCVIVAKNDRVALALEQIYTSELHATYRISAVDPFWELWIRRDEAN